GSSRTASLASTRELALTVWLSTDDETARLVYLYVGRRSQDQGRRVTASGRRIGDIEGPARVVFRRSHVSLQRSLSDSVHTFVPECTSARLRCKHYGWKT